MLGKLAFAMQRLKKYKKIFCHDQQRCGGGGDNFWILWGDTAAMREDIELHKGKPCPEWQFLEEVQLWALPLRNSFIRNSRPHFL